MPQQPYLFVSNLRTRFQIFDTGKRVGSEKIEPKILTQRLVTPHPERLSYIRYAIRQGHTVKQLAKNRSYRVDEEEKRPAAAAVPYWRRVWIHVRRRFASAGPALPNS